MAENINIKLLIDAAESAKTIQDTKKALRDLKTAALQVEEGSQAFIDITTAAGKLQDKVGDLAATTKYLGDDLKNLKGFTSIATGIAGAFAAAQGAAALFGGENKQLEASLLNVQSAMGILQGIQAVGEVLQEESAASLFITNGLRKVAITLAGEQAIATAATAVANGTATITQRALNAAMNANPIFALVGLLALAATALFAFSNKTKEADESQKALNDTLSKTRANGEIEIKTFNSQIEALKSLKTGSEDRAIAIKKINDQYGTTLKNLTDENAFLKQVNIAQQDYVNGAKNRILMKINEAKIESLLTESQIKNEKSKYAASKANEILDKNDLLRKQLKGKTEIEILNSTFVSAEGLEYQRLLLLSKTSKEEADILNKRADNALNINAKLITNETAQQKAAREKEADDALKAEQDKAKTLADNKAKTDKEKQKAEEDHLKKMADLNAEYQTLLSELAIETNDNLLEQQAIQLSLNDSESNAIATQRLDTEVKITEENRKQEAFLRKLVEAQVKIEEEKLKGTGKTVDVSKVTAGQINTVEYQKYLTTQYAITTGIAAQGEKAILQIQKDYAIQRQKLFEETQKRVLASDEYDRFITFLNKTKELQNKLEDYEKKFGKKAAEQMKLDEKAREADKEYRAELELLVKTKEQLIATENALLLTNQRNVEYQKKISQELVDEGLQTQEDANKAVADTADANLKSAKTIAEALEVVRKAKQSLAEDPVQTTQTSKMVLQNKTGPEKTQIPTLSSEGELQKAYEKYKGQTEKLFDLQRQSNLDQLGNNEKSIEILSALYGEKFNVVKNGEDKINEILAKLPKRPENPVPVEFQFIPKPGQIGLKELVALENADVKKAMENLNVDLDKSYKENFENEQKYFEKSTFENYNTQQQKLADNKAAFAAGGDAFVKREGILTKEGELRARELEINKEFNDKDKTLKENHEENLLAIGVVAGEKTQEDVVQFGKDRLAEKERQAAEEKAIEDKKNAYLIAAGQSLYNTLRSQIDDYQQNNLDRIEQERELRVAAIDAELLDFDNRDKQITAAEQAKIDERKAIEDKKALIQAEYDKKLRDEKIKQFNINKAMDVIQIGINTAVAVSRSLIPPATVMIPFIIAAGAAEAFFVAAQQPNFADGGLVIGPGGPKDDMVNANLSNGEVVINAKSSKKYAQVLDAINQAGGGKPIPYKDGGLVTNTMQVADNTNMEDFKSLILDIVNRPIETYVKESSITNAQKSQSQQNRRTSF
jgi:hypothetical protein